MLDLTRVRGRMGCGVQVPARIRDLGGRAGSGQGIGLAAWRSREMIERDEAHAYRLALLIVQDKLSLGREASGFLVRERCERDWPCRRCVRDGHLEDRMAREEFLVNLQHGREILEGGRWCEDPRDTAVAPRGRQRKDDIAEVLTIAPKGVRHCVRPGDRKRAMTVE